MKTFNVAYALDRTIEDSESFQAYFTDGTEVSIPKPLYQKIEKIMATANNRSTNRAKADSIIASETLIKGVRKLTFEVVFNASKKREYLGAIYI